MEMENTKCILTQESIIVKELFFERDTFENINKEEYKLRFDKNFSTVGDDKKRVKAVLSCNATNGDNILLSVKIAGIFRINSEEREVDVLYPNIIAILFSILRGQVILLTSQPQLEPIVLPLVNTANLFSYEEND